jgi:hypothetical protein
VGYDALAYRYVSTNTSGRRYDLIDLVVMSQVQTMPGQTIPDLKEVLETGEPVMAHIVKTEAGESAAAKVLEARIYGTQVEALCGYVWVPSRDPKKLPLCQKCKEVYDMYKAFNDGLNDQPDQ